MPLVAEIVACQDEFTGWRRKSARLSRDAFEEHETAAFVAGRLREFGADVSEGVAGDRRRRDPRQRRRSDDRAARRPRCAADRRAEHLSPPLDPRRQDACLRARRAYRDAAGSGPASRRHTTLSRHRPLHLPAGRGERGGRPGDGRGRTVPSLSRRHRLRSCTIGRGWKRAASPSAPGRSWPPAISSRSKSAAAAVMAACRILAPM